MEKRAGKPEKLEFGGPVGNALIVIFLPLFTYYLYFCIRFNNGHLIPAADTDWQMFLTSIRPTWSATLAYAVWFGLQAFLQQVAPGKKVPGTPRPAGEPLLYNINGMFAMWVSFVFVGVMHWTGIYTLDRIYHEFGALLSAVTIFSFVFSTWLYFYGKRVDPYRLSGNAIHDFWMGTGHNPRWPNRPTGLDLKFFCEGRPGLIGWMVINAAFAFAQHTRYGFVSTGMWLVLVLQFIYVLNYFQSESFVLTTMDIRHEKFGFMLVFGDLVWVPFTYCLQAFYLIDHAHNLPWWGAVLIVIFNGIGYFLFRASNLQKDRFKADPDGVRIWGKKPETITTASGGKLLVSGYWGRARHFNYLGDWMMALAWSLPCMFDAVVPYFYPIYFAVLLIHRERRDDHMCLQKYGADWEEYRQRVPWRIVPGVY